MKKECCGSYGWKEFNQNKEDILNEFDKIKSLTERRPVRTAHGVAVEAFIRKWLSQYLPKKYAVTSGYVIPDVYDFNYRLYHYDVIIYNQIESPILWVESNLDDSDSGKSRAIPAKYVEAIYEIKSTLDKQNAIEAINKLKEINSFAAHLPRNFSSGSIFIELKKNDVSEKDILAELFAGNEIPGYWGGVILRCEIDPSMTGLFTFATGEGGDDGYYPDINLAKPIDELKIYLQVDGSLKIEETGGGAQLVVTAPHTWSVIKEFGPFYRKGSKVLMLSWSHSKFAEFAIQVISCLEGIPYNNENRPKYGQVFDSVEKKEAENQSELPIKGFPHLSVTPCRFENSGDFIEAEIIEDSVDVKVRYEIENIGDVTALVSTDGFKTSVEVGPGERKYHIMTSKISSNPPKSASPREFIDILNEKEEIFKIELNLLYSPQDKRIFFKKAVSHVFGKNKVRSLEI